MSNFVENSPEGVVDGVEIIARFVISKRWVRENKTVQPDAFIPPPDLQLSTTRHKGLTEQELWNVGEKVADQRGKPLVDRAQHGCYSVEE